MTYEQLAAPVADRANHDLFAPLAVFPGGFRTSIRESRDRSRRQAKARATLKQRTVGLGAEQIDDLIDPIWAEHDLPPPPAHVRPLLVERVVHNPSRLDDLRTTADIVQGYAKWGSRIVNLIRHQDRYTPESAGDWEPGMHVRTGPESVEVQLDGDAQSRLADLGDEAYFVARTYAAITVELRAGADGSVEVWNSSVLGRQADSRFGVVSAADAEPYRDDLAAAVASGRPLRSRAIRTQGPDETWRLYLFLPAGGQWKPP